MGSTSPRTFFGHPRGLATLFFSEMWERFSYYGMRGFLILYMTAAATTGGMGLDTATAAAIYGTYTSLVYLMSLPGGWIADRWLGQRRAVLVGGVLIAAGHFSLAVPATTAFFVGLLLVVLGTGLLKPNISVLVGHLYAPDDTRRDAAFSIFYMGINLGAFFGPFITGYLAQSDGFRARLVTWDLDPNSAWHWGFGAAGVGMTAGLVQYMLGQKSLVEGAPTLTREGTTRGPEGRRLPPNETVANDRASVATQHGTLVTDGGAALQGRAFFVPIGGAVTLAALIWAVSTGALPLTLGQVAGAYGYVLLLVTVAFFAWLFLSGGWTPAERNRLYLIGVFFVAAALFWSVFEQAGSTLNLFADRSTDNVVFGYAFPSSWWQAVNAFLIFVLAPAFAWLWVRLGRRQPASPTKFALGLVGVGVGFLVLVPGAALASSGAKVGLGWLFMTYLLHTMSELCLSPVGLSSMTKLAPSRIAGLMMGVWFLGASVGNFLGGQAASFYETMPLTRVLGAVAVLPILAGLGMLVWRRRLAQLG